MVGWHHRLNGREFEQTLGDSEGQGSLECCSPWSHKESDISERLNNKYEEVEQIVGVFHVLLGKEMGQESREDPAVRMHAESSEAPYRDFLQLSGLQERG